MTFQESKVLNKGDSLTLIDTEYGKIGIGICYDLRFPEMAMIAARQGAMAMIYPGAFNMTTGPLHVYYFDAVGALAASQSTR